MTLAAADCLTLSGVVKRGYGVASGSAADPRFPAGTLRLQMPHFKARGLDLSDCYPGTINLDISPWRFAVGEPDYRFEYLRWSPDVPVETFSFCRCEIEHNGSSIAAWIYYPHPDTKPEHFQDAATVEILAPRLEGIGYGDRLTVRLGARAGSIK